MEPRLGDRPLALDRRGRDSQCRGRLFNGEAAEKAELDDLRFSGIDLFELLQRPVEIERFDRVERGGCGRNGLVQRDRQAAPAPLLMQLVARLVDENAPNQLGSDRKEVPPVLPVDCQLEPPLTLPIVAAPRGIFISAEPLSRVECLCSFLRRGRSCAHFVISFC